MREKFDIDGEPLTDGVQVALLDSDDLSGPPVLLLRIADLQTHTPLIKVEVVALLGHQHANLFTVGELFEALPQHLSRRLATLPVSVDDE